MRILSTLAFLFLIGHLKAQVPSEKLEQLKSIVTTIRTQVDFKDKLVIVSVWSVEDIESRELNKEAYRVYKIYERAKLKNGEKGTVFISLALNADDQARTLATNKDGIDPALVYSETDLKNFLNSAWSVSTPKSNIIMDKTGEIKYQNVSKDLIFSSVRNLITR